MRILVYPHDLGLGGSQLNAIEIAAATRDLGHDVLVYGRSGALNTRVSELQLDFIESPQPRRRPSVRVVRDLRRVVRERAIDVVHGYEWPPTLEARLAARGSRAACLSTVMSMAVAPFIPHQIPLVVGTEQIAAVERSEGRRDVRVLEPPVDCVYNGPEADVDVDGFRARYGLSSTDQHVVCVTRLAKELKLEGILVAIDQVPRLGPDVTLVLVGDGPARAEVEAAAETANTAAGRPAVVLTGELPDPRAAYAAADVVLGMGGSALRALAFEKPLIVQGERGFWKTLTPECVDLFLWTGWYGVGTNRDQGGPTLMQCLKELLRDAPRRAELGAFGRDLAVFRFSLQAAAATQVGIYADVVAARSGSRVDWSPDLRGVRGLARYKAARIASRLQGTRTADDFNANPAKAERT